MKRFYSLLSLYIALLCCVNARADELTLYGSDTNTEGHFPVYGLYMDTPGAHQQFLYPKTDIEDMSGVSITGLKFYSSTGGNQAWSGNVCVIKMAEVSDAECSTSFITADQIVYTGTLSVSAAQMVITLDNAFSYEGDGNLLIDIVVQTKGAYSSHSFYGKSMANNMACWATSGNIANAVKFVPRTTFTYESTTPATCPKPKDIAYAAISSTSATITWKKGDTESAWILQYSSDNGANWSSLNLTTAEVTVSGAECSYTLAVSPVTTYQVKVQADCGGGDISNATSAVTFTTPCGEITSLPWKEDFTGYSNFATPDCWNHDGRTSTSPYAGGDVVWAVYSFSGNEMLWMKNFHATTGDAIINSPVFALPDRACELVFDYSHRADCGSFQVKVSTDGGSSFSSALASFGNTSGDNNYYGPESEMHEAVVSLYAYRGQNIIIQFYALANYSSGAIYLDNIRVRRVTTCATPSTPSVSHILSSTARLTWTAGGSESAWNILYRKAGTPDWTTISNITANPYTLTNLDYQTTYEAKIQAVCGVDDESEYSDIVTFTTPCTAYGTPWVENFENEAINEVATCFDNSSSTAQNNATGMVTGINAIWQTHECNDNKFARMGAYWAGEGMAILNTPQIILPADEVQELTFDYANNTYFENIGAEIPVELKLNISTDGGASFTELKSYVQSGSRDSVNPGTFIEEAIVLDAYVGQTIILQFVTNNPQGNSAGAVFVDNLDVHRYTDCKKPKSLTCTATTIYGATLDWTAGSDETQWLLQYSENGVLWSKEITVDSKPYTLTNLSPGTFYFARVRAVCDETEMSAYSNVTTFTTQCGTYTIDDLPWAHNFENDKPGSGLIPSCWTSTPYSYTDGYGDTKTYPYVYKFDTLTDNNYKRAHNGEKYLCFYGGSTTVPSVQYIVLPEIEEDLETLTLVFWHKQFQTGSDYPYFTVGYVTDINDIDGTFHAITDADRTTAWTKDSIDFKEEGVSGTGYVAFRWGGGTNVYNVDYGYIDGIEICPDKYIFTNEDGDHRWENPLNWNKKAVPQIIHDVIIRAEAEVNEGIKGTVKSAVIDRIEQRKGRIQINPNGVLVIENDLRQKNIRRTPVPTSSDYLIVNSSAAGNGVLTIGNHDGTNCATINFYTKSRHDANGWINQFIGSPFNYNASKDVYVDYYLSYLYKFDPSITDWVNQKHGTPPEPYIGYNILRKKENPDILPMNGSLVPTANHTYNLYYAADHNQNVLANSWTAPIDIASIGTAAFVNAEATIYLFNAGSKPQNKGTWSDDGTFVAEQASQNATQEGQFIALPVGSAPWVNPSVKVIPPMQAFIVIAEGANAKLNIDYQSMVYTPTLNKAQSDITAPTRAPKHLSAITTPDILRVHITGHSGYADVLNILVREDFTDGFDNGYDGRKFAGSSPAPLIYALSEDGEMAVLCVDNAEGTKIGLLTGTDSMYCFTFEYDGEQTLYLNDYETVSSTRINGSATYIFRAENSTESRFVISATPIANISTDIDYTPFPSREGWGEASKVLRDNQLYIIRAGKIYSATGTLIR